MIKNKKELSREELLHFNEFLMKQISLTHARHITPLYRGDNLENLHEKLGLEYNKEKPDYAELLKRLFMVGEKARHFYSGEYFNLINREGILINDVNEVVFNYIFDNIHSSTKDKKPRTRDFFNKNSAFKDFFFDKKNNKKIFSASALSSPIKDQFLFRNYYLTLLHQLNAINYRNDTHIVSTSSNYSVAGKFALGRSSGKRIIIHCWIPTSNILRDLIKNNLPIYEGAPYKEQHEVSLLAGILPHFIIGLRIVEDKLFFINPSIFNNRITNSLFKYGIEINQTNFIEIIRQTNYGAAFEMNEDEIWEI